MHPLSFKGREIQTQRYIDRIGILSYTDYYLPPVSTNSSIQNPIPTSDEAARTLIPKLRIEDVVSWSGWDEVTNDRTTNSGRGLLEWLRCLKIEGGGDYPEAAKTALRKALDIVSESMSGALPDTEQRSTLVLWFTDAPPHHRAHRGINRLLEILAHGPASREMGDVSSLKNGIVSTKKLNAPTPTPPLVSKDKCLDWINLCLATQAVRGNAQGRRDGKDIGAMNVWSILPPTMQLADITFYTCLGTISGGGTIVVGGPVVEGRDSKEGYDGESEFDNAEEKAKASKDVGHLVEGRKFATKLVSAGRAVVFAALGLEVQGKVESREELMEDEDGDGWLRLVSFKDNLLEYLPMENDKGKKKEWQTLNSEDDWTLGFLPLPWKGSQPYLEIPQMKHLLRHRCTPTNLLHKISATNSKGIDWKRDIGQLMKGYDKNGREGLILALTAVIETDVEALPEVEAFSEAWIIGMIFHFLLRLFSWSP